MVSASCLPNGVWAQPTIAALMTFLSMMTAFALYIALRHRRAASGQSRISGVHGKRDHDADRAMDLRSTSSSSSPTPTTIIAMPAISRRLVPSAKMRREAICASGTSISASVRTLAALVSEKPMNQNCEAAAPRKPAEQRPPPVAQAHHQRRAVGDQHVERQHHRLQRQTQRQDRGRADQEAALRQGLDRRRESRSPRARSRRRRRRRAAAGRRPAAREPSRPASRTPRRRRPSRARSPRTSPGSSASPSSSAPKIATCTGSVLV